MMITQEQYQYGIIDICDSLVTDLLRFLKDEGRYKYRMISYMKKITDSLESLYDNQTDEEIEVYERIIYLMRKSITHEYRRLRVRKLSPADSVICIIWKLLEYTTLCPKEAKEIFQKFYDNIRNRKKLDKLLRIENTIKEAMEKGTIGKLKLSDLDLYSIEHPAPKTQELKGESLGWGRTDGKEIEL